MATKRYRVMASRITPAARRHDLYGSPLQWSRYDYGQVVDLEESEVSRYVQLGALQEVEQEQRETSRSSRSSSSSLSS